MSSVQRVARAACVVAVAAWGGAPPVAQAQGEIPRVIMKSATPIADQLRPDDVAVLLKQEGERLYRPPGAREPVFGVDTPDTHLVAVVRLERATGMLAEEGRWINTSFVGVIQEAVFARPGVVSAPGTPLEFQTYGGSVTIGATVVSTERRRQLTVGRDYLVFFQNAGHAFYYTTGEILEVRDGLLVPPPPSPGDVTLPGSGEGLRLADAIASIRRFGSGLR